MNFAEYRLETFCTLLIETEQSRTYTVEREGEKRVCKHYPTATDRHREELGYEYLAENHFFQIPRLTLVGKDFIEIEFIDRSRDLILREKIKGISRLYVATIGDLSLGSIFPSVDLSLDKVLHRLAYLPEEMARLNLNNKPLLDRANEFAESEYSLPARRCLVHGDLKSAHIIANERGVYYIDFGLMAMATPWYDLAFLYMEQKDKTGVFEGVLNEASEKLRDIFGGSTKINRAHLRSAIFYRCLYNLIYSLRHKPMRTIERTMRELEEIIE